MKKKFTGRLGILLLMVVLIGTACMSGSKKEAAAGHQHEAKTEYTCPMHPQIVKDAPGQCPICGMDLVSKQTASHGPALDSNLTDLVKPVNEQVVAAIPTITPESGTRIHSLEVQGTITYDTRRQTRIASRVSGRIERLYIKFNYQPVKKGQLIMELYSPDLAAAQREAIYLARTNGNHDLLQKAKKRLQLLGMSSGQIAQVVRTGKVLYRVPVYSPVSGYILETGGAATAPVTATTPPSAGDGGMNSMGSGGGSMAGGALAGGAASTQTTVQNAALLLREGQYASAGQSLFAVYTSTALVAEFSFDPTLAAQIKRGQKLVFRKTADPQTAYTGTIGLIQPTFRPGGNFTIARVYLNDARFQTGQLVTANIPIVNRGWWLPQAAVLELGSKTVVFKKEGTVFVPKAIQAGVAVQGMVLIRDSIGGWEIANSAAYLVDSESFIKTHSTTGTEEL